MIMGIGSEPSPGEVQYMNVTDNITVYENSSYDLHDENGTQISYYDFHENEITLIDKKKDKIIDLKTIFN